ncbi:MAG: Fur family transcriptional regulator [Anaerolineae bacterium]
MNEERSLGEVLREWGLRLTPQRLMILEVIEESEGHISAEEIYERVRQEYPYLDISTVYRTLELLKELHLVTETDLGNGYAQYELLAKGRHHHMVCRRCGSTLSLDHRFLEPLHEALLGEYGFKADIDHFAIFGICATCRQSIEEQESSDG